MTGAYGMDVPRRNRCRCQCPQPELCYCAYPPPLSTVPTAVPTRPTTPFLPLHPLRLLHLGTGCTYCSCTYRSFCISHCTYRAKRTCCSYWTDRAYRVYLRTARTARTACTARPASTASTALTASDGPTAHSVNLIFYLLQLLNPLGIPLKIDQIPVEVARSE